MFAGRRRLRGNIARVSALLLATTIGLTAPQPAQPQTRLAQNQRLTATIQYAHVSPPQSGVRLLEEVFQRVRSAPQVAMAKNSLKVAQQALPQAGPTDYNLAIRPKVTGKIAAAQAPALRLVPSEPATADAVASGSPVGSFGNAIAGGGGAGSGGTATLIAKSDAPSLPEAWLGNRQLPFNAGSSNARRGLWEKQYIASDQALDGESASQGLAAQNAPGYVEDRKRGTVARRQQYVPDLATAAGRLMNVAKQFEEAERLSSVPSAAMSPPVQSPTMAQQRAEKTAYREKHLVEAKPLPAAAAPAPRSPVKGKSSAKKEALPYDELDDGYLAKDKNRIAMSGDLALLPPNVVTGIPLVRLGISEGQASNALSAIGSMKQQKVNKWSVWTWQRTQSKNNAALQLYMRNGLLDAMRIFDPSLIASDFGVTMGDDLCRVKEKFGEPAFILQEPGPGAGQNYIYPISQVGFQLARPAPDQQPRVVSVLIFNVK